MNKEQSQNQLEKKAVAIPTAPSVEDEQLREGYSALTRGELETAVRIFETYYKKYGTTMSGETLSRLLMEMADTRFQLGDYSAAVEYAERVVKAKFDADAAHVLLGKISLAQFQFRKAQGYFENASVGCVGRHLGLCLMAARMRRTQEAQKHLNAAQKADTFMREDPEFQILFIYVMFLQGDIKGALAAAREIGHKVTKDPTLLLLVAEILVIGGHSGEANALAQQAQQMAPQHDQVFAIRALSENAGEHFEQARTHAEFALERNPYNAFAQTVLMKCASRSGNYAEAERRGMAILENSPEYSLGHANLGDVFFNQGRYELARIEYEQTDEHMDSVTKGALLRKARTRYIEGDYSGAAHILEQLINIYHTYYDDATCDLLLCYEAMREDEKKEALMDKMELRKDFYKRTESLLEKFNAA